MRKLKILVLGGTKFVGSAYLDLLLQEKSIEVVVASRTAPRHDIKFINFDRKQYEDMKEIFCEHTFDVVIDFICFSYPDAEKLIAAIKASKTNPYLISISSTYVYGHPAQVLANATYREDNFKPEYYLPKVDDRPIADYFEGKRSAENFIATNYENFLLVRFPIILGVGDYTGRTSFFSDLIKGKKQIHFDAEAGKSNFIIAKEASEALFHLTQMNVKGSLNICFDESLSQSEIFEIYCKHYDQSLASFLSNAGEFCRSPFYYQKDFIIDNQRQKQLTLSFKNSFESAIHRELSLLDSILQ